MSRPMLHCAIGSLLLALTASISFAHPGQYAAANVKLMRDGSFQIRLRFDLLAFALNDTPGRIDDAPMNALLDGPSVDLRRALDAAQQRLLRGLTIRCDSAGVVRADSICFPTVADVCRWRDSNILPRLPVLQEATLGGRLPPTAHSIAIRFPEVIGTLVLTIERPGEETSSEPLEGGRFSSTWPIDLNRETATHRSAPLTITAPAGPSARIAAFRFLSLGFAHILPHGLDHVLFVLGLFLLSPKLRPLLWQVTAFTLAHSITLALSLYGVVRLPANIVEPLIAISIAFIAIENICTTRLHAWRPMVVFGFGLVHGLGFAGVLQEMQLPRSQFATALIGFNAGVELGQLAVLAIAFAAVGSLRGRTWYRGAIAMPASIAIALLAIFWTVQRLHAAI